VPIILAETIMAKNPEQYGLQLVAPQPPPPIDHVTIDYPVDLRLVAECVDTAVDYLQELNPSLLRMTTPKDMSFILNLPAGSAQKYQTEIAAIPPDMRTYWRYHPVEYGDTLPAIARKYHVSASAIEEANNLSDDDLKAGTKLIIPIAPGHHDSQAVAYSHHPIHYTVRKGDTVASIAEDFEVPVDKVRKWNHLRGGAVTPGRVLVIYRPASGESAEVSSSEGHSSAPEGGTVSAKSAHGSKSASSRSTQTAKYHKVKKGETLSSIAESNHVSVAELKRENPRLTANLRAGDVLVIRK
jgi:membrane-bound lytic murein transglycosylase D